MAMNFSKGPEMVDIFMYLYTFGDNMWVLFVNMGPEMVGIKFRGFMLTFEVVPC